MADQKPTSVYFAHTLQSGDSTLNVSSADHAKALLLSVESPNEFCMPLTRDQADLLISILELARRTMWGPK